VDQLRCLPRSKGPSLDGFDYRAGKSCEYARGIAPPVTCMKPPHSRIQPTLNPRRFKIAERL
jgi:hypothetical protein